MLLERKQLLAVENAHFPSAPSSRCLVPAENLVHRTGCRQVTVRWGGGTLGGIRAACWEQFCFRKKKENSSQAKQYRVHNAFVEKS